MQTGSLVNLLLPSTTRGMVPEVGMGATKLGWSDRFACTIIAVKGRTIQIQEDTATRTDTNGMSENQTYVYAPCPQAAVETFTLRKNGKWVRKGEPMNKGVALAIGLRDEYYDYSF